MRHSHQTAVRLATSFSLRVFEIRDLFRRGHLELEEAIQALGVLAWVGGSSSYKLVDVLVVLFTSPASVCRFSRSGISSGGDIWNLKKRSRRLVCWCGFGEVVAVTSWWTCLLCCLHRLLQSAGFRDPGSLPAGTSENLNKRSRRLVCWRGLGEIVAVTSWWTCLLCCLHRLIHSAGFRNPGSLPAGTSGT